VKQTGKIGPDLSDLLGCKKTLPGEIPLSSYDQQGQGRQYRNPPIEEAVCQFSYRMNPCEFGWQGKFYEKIKDVYSGSPRDQDLLGVEGLQTVRQVRKTLFPTADDRELLGITADELSVHVLRPYSGWDRFRQRIVKAKSDFEDLLRPAGIKRVALRYINRIVLPETDLDLGKYFTFFPMITDTPPGKMTSFFVRTQSVYNDKPVAMNFTFTDHGAKTTGRAAFILDFDLFQEWSNEPIPLSDAMSYVDDLRLRERAAFEDLITDKLREIFNADE